MHQVALHVRAWVEICGQSPYHRICTGRPPCEGVGRNPRHTVDKISLLVALHVRAWVEIILMIVTTDNKNVALHVRAWVEILISNSPISIARCRPPCEGVGRNRSLARRLEIKSVALHVRAWVEIIR